METRNTPYELKQRVFRLGNQKIEEEALLEKIREEIEKRKKRTLLTKRNRSRFLPALRKS
ncbi:hypothetical protein [Tunicatimonas pelagia]|uniref:hypothetical protein n=1 Tax=Tunicatimonas pelagia TaxID=931531 RepID=UPI002665557F|nr:hypothetical protein [Tunicatimonas pelagia]WKN42634.1 hypothetical protein P0M28_26710 [Tunicatimonas pelagia]